MSRVSARHPEWTLQSHAQKEPHEVRLNFESAVRSLVALSDHDIWPREHWQTVLEIASEDHAQQSWDLLSPMLWDMPDEVLLSIADGASYWLYSVAKVFTGDELTFFLLCFRFLRLEYPDSEDMDDPVEQAVSHPVGLVAQALLNFWFRKDPRDDEGLSGEFKAIFTAFFDRRVASRKFGRVLMGVNAIPLFRVDPMWSKRHLLPLFHWEGNEDEAKAVWRGFLWSPRLHLPLMAAMKKDFLDTAGHSQALGPQSRRYQKLLKFAALYCGDIFSSQEISRAMNDLRPGA